MDNLQRQVSAQQYKYADVKQKLDALKAEEKKSFERVSLPSF